MVEVKLEGKVVARSRNLRGVLDYARKSPVIWVIIRPIDSGPWDAEVLFGYADGATCTTNFGSRSVAEWFVFARRSWGRPVKETAANGDICLSYL